MAEGEEEQPSWGIALSKYVCMPQRYILGIMGFLAVLNAYTMRVSLSLAITELVVKPNHTSDSHASIVCPPPNDTLNTKPTTGGTYEWSQEVQGIILGSFYIGYLITHLPGGMLADKFGGKWVLSLGILSTSFLTLLTPFAIKNFGSNGLIALRVLMGLGEGTTFPALSVLLSKWVPLNERGKLGSLVFGGGQVGTIISNSISGFILDMSSWEYVFYTFGIGGMLWFTSFTLLCFNTPRDHPYISPTEKEYLHSVIIQRSTKLPPPPWGQIVTSMPMIALVCAQIGHDWGFYVMVSDLPKYMADILNLSVKANGLYTTVPYVFMWIFSVTSGTIGDVLIAKEIWTITTVRKFMTGLAAYVPAVFMVSASYAGCDQLLVAVLFTCCMAFMGTYYAGMKLGPLDMSPNYAGTLMAITNGIGSITGVVAPTLVGVMTPNSTMKEWRMVFWLAFAVLVLTANVYVIWASGEVQPFNDPKPKEQA